MKKLILLIFFICAKLFDSNAQFTTLFNFDGYSNQTGQYPTGSFISEGVFLYGMSAYSIFKIKPDGTAFDTLKYFTQPATGGYAHGSLISDNTFLYGMTTKGGIGSCFQGCGTIFKIKSDGSAFTVLHDFSGLPDGIWPNDDLLFEGAFLYGMTSSGGANNYGTIFKILPDGSGFQVLLAFDDSTTGGSPGGSLISDGVFLYGLTPVGGANNKGTIFRILPDGSSFTKLFDFADSTGITPYGSLLYDGSYLYGMTSTGGVTNNGTIFKILPDGSGFSVLHFFNYLDGSAARRSLISDGTYLYGSTPSGGISYGGVIFKILPDGSGFCKLNDFLGISNGAYPYGSLFLSGSSLFGMTQMGGTNNLGTIYNYDIGTRIDEDTPQYIFSLLPNPSSGIFTLNSNLTNGEISVSNLLGEIIFQSNINNPTSTINLSNEANGIYFVNVKTEKESFTQKIIIDK